MDVAEAAAVLGVEAVTLRRTLERNARLAADGGTEAAIDGGRGRKFGRLWRVWLSPAWTAPDAPTR